MPRKRFRYEVTYMKTGIAGQGDVYGQELVELVVPIAGDVSKSHAMRKILRDGLARRLKTDSSRIVIKAAKEVTRS